MSEAAYPVVIHRRAKAELGQLDTDVAEELKQRIVAASEQRQPTDHPCVDFLSGHDLLKVKVEGFRAICRLAKPEFQVLLIGKRRTVYDRLSVAERRAQEADDG